jgi:hypothetical protein
VLNGLSKHPLRRRRASVSEGERRVPILGRERTGAWLRSLGITVSLLERFSSYLGFPQDEMLQRTKYIHVAGTKGKGSTCRFAESMLS